MFARLRSLPLRRLVTRAALVAGSVAGLCALADQGARRLSQPEPDRVAAAPQAKAPPTRPAPDPVTTGSIRREAAPASDALDRRGLAVLVSSGAANAVAPAAPPKRKAEPAAQRAR